MIQKLVFTLLFLSSLKSYSRPCNATDYGIVQAHVFRCTIQADGRLEQVNVYSSSAGIKTDTNRRLGTFARGPYATKLSELRCPANPRFNPFSEPTYQNGLDIWVDSNRLPNITVRRQRCLISRRGYNGESEPDWSFKVETTLEQARCQYRGTFPTPTRSPPMSICGVHDSNY